jgi:hypothetical protein
MGLLPLVELGVAEPLDMVDVKLRERIPAGGSPGLRKQRSGPDWNCNRDQRSGRTIETERGKRRKSEGRVPEVTGK